MLGLARVPVVAMTLIVSLGAAVKVEKVAYQGWPNCYRVSNGEIEAIVTGDIGPRIMRFGFVGGQNFFKTYADFGCSFETFTNDEFLEMETLGPITKVAPGESVTHVEHWSLHRGVRVAAPTDAELDRALGPLVP